MFTVRREYRNCNFITVQIRFYHKFTAVYFIGNKFIYDFIQLFFVFDNRHALTASATYRFYNTRKIAVVFICRFYRYIIHNVKSVFKQNMVRIVFIVVSLHITAFLTYYFNFAYVFFNRVSVIQNGVQPQYIRPHIYCFCYSLLIITEYPINVVLFIGVLHRCYQIISVFL